MYKYIKWYDYITKVYNKEKIYIYSSALYHAQI